MYGYIYRLTQKETGKTYIGKHRYLKEELDPHYIASGILINRAIEKHGLEAFEHVLVDTADTLQQLNEKEIYYIQLYDCRAPKGYNLTNGGDGIADPLPEVREKMSLRKKGSKRSIEARRKTSESLKKVIHTEEWVEKISKSLKGHKPAPQTMEANSKRKRGSRWFNNGKEEHMFLPGTEEEGFVPGRLHNPFPSQVGQKKSPEVISKIGAAKRGSKWYNNGTVEIMLHTGTDIPDGYIKGRIKKNSL